MRSQSPNDSRQQWKSRLKTFLWTLAIFASLVFVRLITLGENWEEPREAETRFFYEFLTPAPGAPLPREKIADILFDIKYRGSTAGRAVHLGSQFYLTAWHVIDGRDDDIHLVPQKHRTRPGEYQREFQVLHFDVATDLALLRGLPRPVRQKSAWASFWSGTEPGEALEIDSPGFRLWEKIPRAGDPVSKFIHLWGPKELPEDYTLDYVGLDFFPSNLKPQVKGRVRMDAGDWLYEVRGQTIPFKDSFFRDKFGNFRGRSDQSSFSSIITFNGDSGSPVFYSPQGEFYHFAGIITHSFRGPEKIFKTPGHPLGWKGMEQACGIFSHRDSIQKLIENYLYLSTYTR